jgi:hypothetical protein
MYKLYSLRDRMEPRGTPAFISLGVDVSPSTETLNFLCVRNELISFIRLVENSIFDDLYSKHWCYTVSTVSSTSKNTAAVNILFLKLRVTWSQTTKLTEC